MDKKRCETCECYDCDCEDCSCDCHHNDRVSTDLHDRHDSDKQEQRFKNIDDCLYFAERLTNQPTIPHEDGSKKITAYCKPINR